MTNDCNSSDKDQSDLNQFFNSHPSYAEMKLTGTLVINLKNGKNKYHR